jgi:hypothetical protein
MEIDRNQQLVKILFWGAAGLLVLTGWFVTPSSTVLFLGSPGNSEIREVDLVSIDPPSRNVAPGAQGRARSHLAYSAVLLGLWWAIILFVAADRNFFGEKRLERKTKQLAFLFAALVTMIVAFLILDIVDVLG